MTDVIQEAYRDGNRRKPETFGNYLSARGRPNGPNDFNCAEPTQASRMTCVERSMCRHHWCFAVSLSIAFFAMSSGVSAETKNTCPPGQRPSLEGCVDGSHHAKVRVLQRQTKVASVPKPDVESGIEPPKAKVLEFARRSLLLKELQQLENALRSTPANAPDRPAMIRRLAEGYAELAALSERQQLEEEMAAEKAARQERESSAAKPVKPSRKRTTTLL